jgi:hypothetical protein
VREHEAVRERILEITLLESGAEASVAFAEEGRRAGGADGDLVQCLSFELSLARG